MNNLRLQHFYYCDTMIFLTRRQQRNQKRFGGKKMMSYRLLKIPCLKQNKYIYIRMFNRHLIVRILSWKDNFAPCFPHTALSVVSFATIITLSKSQTYYSTNSLWIISIQIQPAQKIHFQHMSPNMKLLRMITAHMTEIFKMQATLTFFNISLAPRKNEQLTQLQMNIEPHHFGFIGIKGF